MTKEGLRSFLTSEKVYSPAEIDELLDLIVPEMILAWNNKKYTYYNIPAAFDIETSSFYQDGQKTAIMYEWTFGIGGLVVVGRTWEDFLQVLSRTVERCGITRGRRLIVYVHNLAFEFQFLRKWLPWKKVFAISARTPIYALTQSGVEFRCSYLLSGYSLETLGDELKTFSVRKAVGDLDYSLLRHSSTPMTPEEIGYCVNDVKVVMAYIAERMESDGEIANLPLTKTGYVRKFCRDSCFIEEDVSRKDSWKAYRYRRRMRGMQLDPDEYKQLKRAFQGGFVHANAFYSSHVMYDCEHEDFTSSYPTTLVGEQFPMGPGELYGIKSKEDLDKQLRLYCCLFDLEIWDLKSKLTQENYLSQSRCREVEKPVVNNGRLVKADHLKTTVTEQDFMILRTFYSWSHARITNFRRYKKGYLPTDFVKAVLKLYHDKTTLKGVAGKEIEYARSKEMLNSCFGMCVTDIVRDDIVYVSGEWKVKPADVEKDINRYNWNPGRFLFYPWGVWVTAYARRNLFTAILELGPDYIYSDTDSVVFRNADAHRAYFEKYNAMICKQLLRACEYHEIDPAAIEPETADGVKKLLGAWDFEGHYRRFKTIGAKRYMVEYSDDPRNPKKKRGTISLTVSGLNKRKCVPWLLEKYGSDKIFDVFSDDMYVPSEYSGKLTHTYIDMERRGILEDYTGRRGEYHELSAVHLEGSDYSLSLSQEYVDFLSDYIAELKLKRRVASEAEILQSESDS